ncbi:hypothetical protein [Streptomyces sp. NBC_01207]|uniref:hypothetical protein n=1 Tax=Streptomyces sp. NBC_01207 TaxID=2903772 RepID=UPI002E102062|nr:hypothetical protein OG457_00635 [Streptomyces sp. NBC_01207]
MRSNPAKPVFFCFSCAIGYPTVVPRARCDRPVDSAGVTSTVLCNLYEMHLEEEQHYRPSHESPEDYGYTEERG